MRYARIVGIVSTACLLAAWCVSVQWPEQLCIGQSQHLDADALNIKVGSCPGGVSVLVQNYCFMAATSCTQAYYGYFPNCCTGALTINTACSVESGPVANGGYGNALNIHQVNCVGTFNTGPCLCATILPPGGCYVGAALGPFICNATNTLKNAADSC